MSSVVNKITDFLRVFSPKEQRRYFTSAIILSAGSGERFGNENGRKQFYDIAGVPAVVRSIRTFEASEYIHEIILVTGKDDVERCEEYKKEYSLTKISKILPGGADRQASVKIGFDAISPNARFVAIHDGVRCLVTEDIIKSTVRAAYEHGAAVAAEKCRDTIKRASPAGVVEESPDRSAIWLAKTPQIFLSDMYRAAVYTAEKDHVRATDDSMLVERIGFKVHVVDCGSENIKITVPIDVQIAEAILKARGEE